MTCFFLRDVFFLCFFGAFCVSGKTGNTGCPPDSGNISSLPRACNRQACWLMQVVVCRYEILNTPMFVDMFFVGDDVLWSKCICCTHCLLESKDFMFFVDPLFQLPHLFINAFRAYTRETSLAEKKMISLLPQFLWAGHKADISHEEETTEREGGVNSM